MASLADAPPTILSMPIAVFRLLRHSITIYQQAHNAAGITIRYTGCGARRACSSYAADADADALLPPFARFTMPLRYVTSFSSVLAIFAFTMLPLSSMLPSLMMSMPRAMLMALRLFHF